MNPKPKQIPLDIPEVEPQLIIPPSEASIGRLSKKTILKFLSLSKMESERLFKSLR
jgi:hypothetical protein